MSCILFVDDEDATRRINIDELYEKEQRRDLKQLSIFNKILNRIHKRITTTNRMKRSDKYIWFAIPEFIFGEPIYDKGDCIAYVVSKLNENGFFIKYMHPNTLFISWENWVPTYKRNEIKKKTGLVLDEKGNIVDKQDKSDTSGEDINAGMFNTRESPGNGNGNTIKPTKQYTPINQYKPTGNLVYNKDIFDKIEKKVSFA
jgi:hypothetical protein